MLLLTENNISCIVLLSVMGSETEMRWHSWRDWGRSETEVQQSSELRSHLKDVHRQSGTIVMMTVTNTIVWPCEREKLLENTTVLCACGIFHYNKIILISKGLNICISCTPHGSITLATLWNIYLMFVILLIIHWVEQWITLLYVLPTSDLTTVCSPAYSVSCLLSPRCFRPLCFNLEMYSNYSHTLTWLSWCLKGFSMDISNVFLHVVDMIVWNVSYGLNCLLFGHILLSFCTVKLCHFKHE